MSTCSGITIILVRHCQSQPSREKENADWDLSEDGKHQADILAEQLVGMDIDLIYSSPYKRAIESIQPLAQRLGKKIVLESESKETSECEKAVLK